MAIESFGCRDERVRVDDSNSESERVSEAFGQLAGGWAGGRLRQKRKAGGRGEPLPYKCRSRL